MKYIDKVDGLQEMIIDKLKDKARKSKIKSEFVSDKVLVIKDDDFMYNLKNQKYLKELSVNNLIDNEGYHYSYYVLTIAQLAELLDYFNEKNN